MATGLYAFLEYPILPETPAAVEEVYWVSRVPAKCDTCEAAISTVFYDMKTRMGMWGCLCTTCATMGPGINKLGLGYGQKFEKQEDNRWLKTAG